MLEFIQYYSVRYLQETKRYNFILCLIIITTIIIINSDTLSHLEAGKMNTRIKLRRILKHLSKGLKITHVDLIKTKSFLPGLLIQPTNLCNAIKRYGRRIGEIVNDDHRIVEWRLKKACNSMRTDVSTSTSY